MLLSWQSVVEKGEQQNIRGVAGEFTFVRRGLVDTIDRRETSLVYVHPQS